MKQVKWMFEMKMLDFKIKTWDDIYNLNCYNLLLSEQYRLSIKRHIISYNNKMTNKIILISFN